MGPLLLLIAVSGSILNLQWSGESAPVILQTPIGERITMVAAPSIGTPGAPLFPAVPLTVALPEGAVADKVVILHSNTIPLSYDYNPMPAQMGVPISRPGDFTLTPADRMAFSKPVEISASLEGQGTLMGYPVADIVINPVSWDPDSKNLVWAESVELQLYYHFDSSYQAIPSRGTDGDMLAYEIVASSVINPSAIPSVRSTPTTELPWGEYLIIADDDLAEAFEPLAEWKTLKGIPAVIVGMSYITDAYYGVDDAQKLRFFLNDIFQDSPPTYILLAGDTPGVPHRNCYATAEGYEDDPSSDLYFQDMNDTAPGVDAWNINGNSVWGELNGVDNLDYHPDYVLGRASVETVAEAEIFVNKVLAWEDSPDTDDWYTSMGFTTSVLWSSPYCPGSAGKENVDSLYTPEGWSVTKLYEDTGTQSYTATMTMLNKGMQLVNHAGHGSEGSVSIGPGGSLGSSEFMGLTNFSQNGRPTIWNTIACLSGSFDTGTCLAESWIRSPGGGGFCIMNTRYGWGEPAEPGGQWSDLVDQEFFANFFMDDMYHLGVAFMMAKDDFIALVPSDTHYDWIAKSNTLFGDPELPMYTSVPEEIETGLFGVNEGDLSLSVSVTSEGTPLQNARVCLIQGEWDAPITYAVGITDASGNVTLTWPVPMPGSPDQVRLTVWARDHVLLTGMNLVGNLGTEWENSQTLPTLSLNSPNPIRGNASISWSMPGAQAGEIAIIDLAGRTVGVHGIVGIEGVFTWQANDNPAGIYFIRMTTSDGCDLNKRMVVVR